MHPDCISNLLTWASIKEERDSTGISQCRRQLGGYNISRVSQEKTCIMLQQTANNVIAWYGGPDVAACRDFRRKRCSLNVSTGPSGQ